MDAITADRDREDARRAAGNIVTDLRTAVVTIVIGHEQGEPGLVTAETIEQLRQAVNLLEQRCLTSGQRS